MAEVKIGAVMVIGAGIGGIQAALDLVDLGFKVYIIETNPSIGGVMAQLDKTFPTNDCSMCILAPKMVEIARNPNIKLFTLSEIDKIEGKAGNFSVTIKKKPRYIDETKCKNCGLCSLRCPIQVPDEYNESLTVRASIYIPFPQAIPSINLIDPKHCLYLRKKICKVCEKTCEAKAINFEQIDEFITLNVGSIILTVGSDIFDASNLHQYGYGRFQNVINSLEFERILNASGPFGGHVVRPSDQTPPKKILWLNCVGSRNRRINNNYCSSVCCMYSIKEALITKEHNPSVDCTIFFIDIRAVGKGFDEYYVRARESGINFIKTRASVLEEDPITQNIHVKYESSEIGEVIEEEFDLVVLSVGLEPSNSVVELCKLIGVDLNSYEFCLTNSFSPLETSLPGIFVCGTLSGPKDIPETVAEASGAAGKASSLLFPERYKLVIEKQYPSEIDVSGQDPRIGVFVCHCGINIGSVVNVPEVVKFAKDLPNVIYVEENLYTCSQDTQEKIKQVIKDKNLNRIVVASCTPRTHEPLFQNTIREAGLNRYLFDLANIREHCSWVHMSEPEEATEKAKEIVAMSVSKVGLLESVEETSVDITQGALVIGGGIAGLTAALEFAKQGYDTYLIEKDGELGGLTRKIHYTLGEFDPQKFLKTLIDQTTQSEKIKVYLNTEIVNIDGFVGNFKIFAKKSIEKLEFNVGIIIVATGGTEYKPTEYLYGKDEKILTQQDLEQNIIKNKVNYQKVVMIQCVGSRIPERPYCSKVCCNVAVKNALKLLEITPNIEITILHKDIRTYGFYEEYYELARKKGVAFIRLGENTDPTVSLENGKLVISAFDAQIGKFITIEPDLLVLSSAILPADNKKLSQMLKVPLDQNGFFLEAHMKLRPLDFATDGIFLCGIAQWPKSIKETIAQGVGAAARGIRLLSAKKFKTDAIIASVDLELCIGCGACTMICPFNAVQIERTDLGLRAVVIPSVCKGCGTCGASCPREAISMRHFTNNQILQQIQTLSKELLIRGI
ncbi:MAG TPA: CoB--CoM heterodisulfide reductase iron-sulfur subunit A family protein [Candidatus Deferrimicrobium sp.]|nr:CoB--CoM heterodisulfide reductase iron-sulfur subunit A family protein [Candidatus Deferrimicrobium sp.]